MASHLDMLAIEFFREFSRFEYGLKAGGFLLVRRKDEPEANWDEFAKAVKQTFEKPPSKKFSAAVAYFMKNPPKKQVVKDNALQWENDASQDSGALRVLVLVRRVRNNLFHGGKFNGQGWFSPERSEELLRHGTVILRSLIRAHPDVRRAYFEEPRTRLRRAASQ